MNHSTNAVALAVAMIAAGTSAYAATPAGNDAMPIANARVSLTQAIAAAEEHAKGKAAKAEFEQTQTGWAYDVEVVSGNQVFDVKVDADKGTVLSSVADNLERDDDHDERD